MLAMSLGLIISTAAFQLFIHSIRVQQLQLSTAEVQDAAVFGFTAINKQIAHANLGASRAMRQQSAWTGIVLTGSKNGPLVNLASKPFKIGNLRGVRGMSSKLVTKNGAGPSNVLLPTKSDQLTIQYRVPFDSYDCEGRGIHQGDMVIERYFTRTDRQRAKNETKASAIVLACDAGGYQLTNHQSADSIIKDNMILENFGDKGVILINRVDFFSIKLGVKLGKGVVYMPIDTYLSKRTIDSKGSLSSSTYLYDAPIVAVEVGVISRGSSSISVSQQKTTDLRFSLQGKSYQIKDKKPNYIRRSLQSVITLRNSRVTQ